MVSSCRFCRLFKDYINGCFDFHQKKALPLVTAVSGTHQISNHRKHKLWSAIEACLQQRYLTVILGKWHVKGLAVFYAHVVQANTILDTNISSELLRNEVASTQLRRPGERLGNVTPRREDYTTHLGLASQESDAAGLRRWQWSWTESDSWTKIWRALSGQLRAILPGLSAQRKEALKILPSTIKGLIQVGQE